MDFLRFLRSSAMRLLALIISTPLIRHWFTGILKAYVKSFPPITIITYAPNLQANILINERQQACLCDFGLARFAERHTISSHHSGGYGGSIRWKAPETLYSDDMSFGADKPSLATDIYAFGMTMYEVRMKNY